MAAAAFPHPSITPTTRPAMSAPVTENKPASLDPVALAESLAAAAEKSAKAIGEFAARNAKSGASLPTDELGLGKAFFELAAQMLANPAKLAESQMNLWWEYMSLWQGSMLRLMGRAGRRRWRCRPRATSASSTRTGRTTSSSTTSSSRYLHHRALAARPVASVRGPRRADGEEGRFLHAPVHRRAGAVQLRADQSGGAARDRREPAARTWSRACTTCSTTSSAATASCASR